MVFLAGGLCVGSAATGSPDFARSALLEASAG